MIQKKGRPIKKKKIKKTEVLNRLIFIRQGKINRIQEEDLILKLNTKIRRLEEMPQSIKTIKILYSKKGTISVLLLNRSDVNKLLIKYRDRLIKTIKAVDILITNIEIVIK